MSSYIPLGTEIGSYRIESAIDRGGMALVYEATDLRLGRRVALKVLSPELSEGTEFRERFLREARFAASLDHPNIVPIYDAGESDGLLYIAMRWVRGGNLAALLRREGALEPERVLAILAPVADALDTAHAVDLIHRDVKPANILLTSALGQGGHDYVYLADFGLTRHTAALTRLTVTGQFIGTLSYISPEQIRGEPLDARTDLYSFGCVAYECLTGLTPFAKQDPAAMLWAHLNDPPPTLSAHQPRFRRADRVLTKAIAKNPRDRYQTCAQFIAALAETLLTDRQRPSSTATAPGVIPADPSRIRGREQLDDAIFTTGWLPAESAAEGPPEATLRIFLVDDHEMVRRGVADLLEAEQDLTVVGQASSAAQALAHIPDLRPDVAVLDMRLPDGNGVELCRELRSRLPELKCLMLTSFTDEQAMLDAVLAGASGYVIKDIKGMDLLSAVRAVGSGQSLLDSRATSAVLNRLRNSSTQADRLAELSEQERAVLHFIGLGLTNRQIGQQMALSENRVKGCVSLLLAKLGVARRTQAAALASELHDQERRVID